MPRAFKVGRNDPCPCGSGKKFKKCHDGPPPQVYTGPLQRRALGAPECFRVVTKLRAALDHFRLTPNPTSDLARMIRELEWLADNLETISDLPRYNRAFPLIEQASRIAFALESLQPVLGADAKVRWLRKRIDRLTTQADQAQDYLFEVEVAGRLARAGLVPAFCEPDITVSLPKLGVVMLPCKRPRTATGFQDKLREAVSQTRKAGGGPAVTIMSIEAILQPIGGKTRAPVGDAYTTREILSGAVELARDTLVLDQKAAINRHLAAEGIAGLFIWALGAAKIMVPQSYASEWMGLSLPRNDERSARIAHAIAQAIHRGVPSLDEQTASPPAVR